MKKHKVKALFGIIIILLITTFCCSCGDSQSNLVSEPSCAVTVPQEDTLQKELPNTKETIKATDPEAEPIVVSPKDDTIQESVNTDNENAEEATPDNQITNDEYPSEVTPEQNDTQDTSGETANNKNSTCILSVRCDTILDNISHFNNDKINILPKDGVIFPETEVIFYPGESVFNVLVREMKRNKIHMEFEMTPIYETAYIRGIANIYEFDCGELSGWLYKVNGKSPNVGCSLYELKNSDKIEWIYTCG